MFAFSRAAEPQGEVLNMRVKEDGVSECYYVM